MVRLLATLTGAAFMAMSAGAAAQGSEARTVSGTVDQSEWAEPGQVTVDLDSGDYRFTPSASKRPSPAGNVPLSGTVAADLLAELNALVSTASAQGLVDMQCAAIDRSERTGIVVSNGGPHRVAIAQDGSNVSSHPDLECWTVAARALHSKLQAVADAARAG
jgi:hypothetical protein